MLLFLLNYQLEYLLIFEIYYSMFLLFLCNKKIKRTIIGFLYIFKRILIFFVIYWRKKILFMEESIWQVVIFEECLSIAQLPVWVYNDLSFPNYLTSSMYLISSELTIINETIFELNLSTALFDTIFKLSFVRNPLWIWGRIRVKNTPPMILISLPLTWVFKLSFFEVSFTFTFHFIVSPLSFIICAASFELVFSLSMFEIAFLLADILSSICFIINLMNSIKFLIIVPFTSHSSSKFGIVSAGNRKRRIVWADIGSLNCTSGIASWTVWLFTSTHALSYASMVVSQINWIWSRYWQIHSRALLSITAHQ